ncbi:hypothetical protein GCM10008986_12140 [Salinibacillus aidingensis]|uniref:SGNH hydrolase-type esterase domain-containing protein n=1 Tax=Salinibacillus aidingensis TaxID=237684 RepID=A0ABN1B2V7_9BACI
MRKILVTVFMLLLVVAIGFVIYPPGSGDFQSNGNLSQNREPGAEQYESESTIKNEEDTISDKVSQTVTDVVEKTIDFFVPKTLKIAAIGDSLTQGVGDETENEGYVGVLRNRLQNSNVDELVIDNYGKRGNRTDQLLTRLKENEDIISSVKNSDVVLITIGANDIMKIVKQNFTSLSYEMFREEQPAYQKRLKEIFETIRQYNSEAHIMLVGLFNPFAQYFEDIPELDKIIMDYNFIGQQVVADYSPATFIPIKDLFINSDKNLFADDHFHPNSQGYELMGERILYYVKQVYEIEQN